MNGPRMRSVSSVAALLVMVSASNAVALRGRGAMGGFAGREDGGIGDRFGNFENRDGDAEQPQVLQRDSTSEPRRLDDTTGASEGDADSHSYDTRDGGTVDTSKTTDGDTTSRDTTWTDADGQSAEHSRSVTKGDGNFNYSGSSSTSAGGSSTGSATGTYSDGHVTSLNTSVSGRNSAGETANHDGNWNRNGDTVNYYGSSWTSTGRNSDAAATVTRTDDGFVAHGAAVTDQGAAAGTVVKSGDDIYRRSVSTNGETVNRNWTSCTGGDCTRTTVTGSVQPHFVSSYYSHPEYYAYYACPPGSMTIVSGASGAIYSCSFTPVSATSIPLAAVMTAMNRPPQGGSVLITSASVLMYKVASDAVVYATTYTPAGMYWEKVQTRYLWVPGAVEQTNAVSRAIARAAHMKKPTANATVITYTIGNDIVYMTNVAPMPGIYSQRVDGLYAWSPGVMIPTSAQHNAIVTAVAAHIHGGQQALAAQVQQMQADKPPPS